MASKIKRALEKHLAEQRKLQAQATPTDITPAQPQSPKELKPIVPLKQTIAESALIKPGTHSYVRFAHDLHREVLGKNYILASGLINNAIDLNHEDLKEPAVLKDIKTTIAGLTDDKSEKTNAESIRTGISLIKKCAEQGIVYEEERDTPKVTQTALIIGQNSCPALVAYTIISILKAKELLILPSTLKVTADKLQFKNATPENTKAFSDLIKFASEHYLDNSDKEDIALVNKALEKLGNPKIFPGEENLLHVAERIRMGHEIAQIALAKKFPMQRLEKGTKLDGFVKDLTKIAVKLRLLGDAIKSGDTTPKIKTNLTLEPNELQAINIEQNPQTGDKLIELSDKFLLMAVNIANEGILQKQVSYGNTLLGTIKECEPPLSLDDANNIFRLTKNMLDENAEPANSKTTEMTATYLASQRNGGRAAILLTLAAYRKGKDFEFLPQSFGFICTKTKGITLEEGVQRQWAHLASVKGTTNLSRRTGTHTPTEPKSETKTGGLLEGTGLLELYNLKQKEEDTPNLRGGTD